MDPNAMVTDMGLPSVNAQKKLEVAGRIEAAETVNA